MEFAVGWDPALETCFAQAIDHSISRTDDCVIRWVGGRPPHYRDIDELLRAFNAQLRGAHPEVNLHATLRTRLRKDFSINMDGEHASKNKQEGVHSHQIVPSARP
jgi:hypothetical protein